MAPQRRPKCNRAKARTVPGVVPAKPKPNYCVDLFKTTVFYDIENRVAGYFGAVFMLSLLADLVYIPKIPYFSSKRNVLNRYFVKMAWGWNLLVLVPFVWLTAYVYCCGEKRRVVRHHLMRVAIATFIWKVWTTIFFVTTAVVSFFAQSTFDISGHCFILIYGSLVVIEEARVMQNWERIRQYPETVRCMSKQLAGELERNYKVYTPVVRGLFVVMAVLQVLWDVMLVITLLYYHTMSEKFIGASVGIGNWYLTYRCWYPEPCLLPRLPGDDVVQYNPVNKHQDANDNSCTSRSSMSSSRDDDSPSESSEA